MAQGLAAQIQAVAEEASRTSPRDRTLLEFEVEFRAIDKIIDQGTRWLQDMRNQLKAREAAATDDAVPAADHG